MVLSLGAGNFFDPDAATLVRLGEAVCSVWLGGAEDHELVIGFRLHVRLSLPMFLSMVGLIGDAEDAKGAPFGYNLVSSFLWQLRCRSWI